MSHVMLRADCARCAALCCVALAFDRSELFAADKAAGARCPHLGAGGVCAIHAERARCGFSGCVSYDCLGAGQRVVQDLFAGVSWEEESALLRPMLRAFQTVSRLHELLQLLEAARKLPLSRTERRRLGALEEALQVRAEAARTLPWNESVARDVHLFLRSLRRHVRQV